MPQWRMFQLSFFLGLCLTIGGSCRSQPNQEALYCGGLTPEFVQEISLISERMQAQQIPYSSGALADCSGIFLRVQDSLQDRCSQHPAPNPSQYRSSRDLARWYHEQGQLTLVHDPLAEAGALKPGMVLFYGQRGDHQKENVLDDLILPGGINHLGIVIAVQKDASGQVTNYALFHGLRPGKPAAITRYHTRIPTRNRYPPFGNGTEPWVAYAPISW
ncbi:MAG: hypothetical protein AAF399_03005 [Bacteroidota bacterium]